LPLLSLHLRLSLLLNSLLLLGLLLLALVVQKGFLFELVDVLLKGQAGLLSIGFELPPLLLL